MIPLFIRDRNIDLDEVGLDEDNFIDRGVG